MGHGFDELAKRIAERGTSRRDVLRGGFKLAIGTTLTFGSGMALGRLADVGPPAASADYAACYQACLAQRKAVIDKSFQQCTKSSESPLYTGPGRSAPWQILGARVGCNLGRTLETHDAPDQCRDQCCTKCNGTCVDLTSDDANCGACGVTCPPNSHCVKGACSNPCADGAAYCPCYADETCPEAPHKACTSLECDPRNCGSCGHDCGTSGGQRGACQCGTCNYEPGAISFCGPCCGGVPCPDVR